VPGCCRIAALPRDYLVTADCGAGLRRRDRAGQTAVMAVKGRTQMKFRTTIELGGKTATGIRVPEEVIAALGAGKRPAVNVTINGYAYRSTVAPMGGAFMLPVSAEVRANAGVAAGDEVEVEVSLDTAPREVIVPPDLAAALDSDAAARQHFEQLSYSNKRRHILSVEGTKNEETRRRRVAKAIEELKAGK
jgi:hypothetical protein